MPNMLYHDLIFCFCLYGYLHLKQSDGHSKKRTEEPFTKDIQQKISCYTPKEETMEYNGIKALLNLSHFWLNTTYNKMNQTVL